MEFFIQRKEVTYIATTEEIRAEQSQYADSWGGVANLREADEKFNGYNRRRIDIFLREKGRCFLGCINTDKNNPILREYLPGMAVKDYTCDFAIPCKDKELCSLIEDWNRRTEAKLIPGITARVLALGGEIFMWA